ncbi:MAG: SDR family oxidoreductase [Oscillospiraceae bacterium]|nr:SDR family oxidoreductase [Oscillospiraceae bacterium]
MKDRVVLVTGSAGSGAGGSGKEIAKKFAKNGAKIVLADINEAAGKATEKELLDAGYDVKFVPCDITDEEKIKSAIDIAIETYGRLDILVNCAFFNSIDTMVADMDSATFDKLMNVNFRGHWLMCKYAIPHLIKNEGANIVNIASIGGYLGDHDTFAYGCAKAAMIQLSRSIATQYGIKGLRCNTVIPGLIMTDGLYNVLPEPVQKSIQTLDHQILVSKKRNQGTDIANATYFLASEEAEYITGTTLVADGGLMAHSPAYYEQCVLCGKIEG